MTARVLVTRAPGSWPGLVARYAGTGVLIEIAPTTTQVEPQDPRPAERALDALSSYAWLVATSGQGVKALTLRLAARDLTLPRGLRVAAVGARTAEALAGIGVTVEIVAREQRASGLAEALAPHLASGTRVLLVKPEGGPALLAAALRSAGARVDEAPLYRTIASEQARSLAERAVAGAFAAVAFTAPSSLDLWLDAAGERAPALRDALSGLKRVAIGPATAAHLEERGLAPHAVAERPDEEATGDAIGRALC